MLLVYIITLLLLYIHSRYGYRKWDAHQKEEEEEKYPIIKKNKKYKKGNDGRVVMVMAALVSSLTFRISLKCFGCCIVHKRLSECFSTLVNIFQNTQQQKTQRPVSLSLSIRFSFFLRIIWLLLRLLARDKLNTQNIQHTRDSTVVKQVVRLCGDHYNFRKYATREEQKTRGEEQQQKGENEQTEEENTNKTNSQCQ